MSTFAQHAEHPELGTWPSTLDDSWLEGTAGGSCGSVVRIALRLEAGRVTECAARVRGKIEVAATVSALLTHLPGQTVLGAAAVGVSRLDPSFAELDPERYERALVAEDALHHALGRRFLVAMRNGERLTPADEQLACVVAMSGGVDSAVALHDAAAEANDKVCGVTLRLWIDPKGPNPERACCAPDSVRRARRTCHELGVPHVSLDLSERFAQTVVAPFLEEYQAGDTPNPCVRCNGSFRLGELATFADTCRAQHIVTGHYARTVVRDGVTLVQRGLDPRKDQSYMLCTLDPEIVTRYRFPLGARTKVETRQRAAKLGLAQARIADSQEICFLGGGNYRGFLRRMGSLGKPGNIELADGTHLGTHDGLAQFTPGQRKGIGVTVPTSGPGAHPDPLYVLRSDRDTGTVVVGPRSALGTTSVDVVELRTYVDNVERATVSLRHRGNTGEATVVRGEGNTATLHFVEPVHAPARGQIACLYDDDGVILGAARIA